MSAIRRKDTKPELAIRSRLHARGYRFRVDHRLDLPNARVRPDIVFTRQKLAIFVDSCFFHVCPEHTPKADIRNPAYWIPKLQGNQARDARNKADLEKAGWRVLRIWSHTDPAEAVRLIADKLEVPPSRNIDRAK
jgi:DNA mismatch endonuclease (patch repair protein)